MNTPRQPVDCATADNGAPASTEPRLPISMLNADQGGKAVLLEPHGNQLEHGNENDRHPQTDQGPPDQRDVERRRQAEQETADAANHAAQHQDAPRPEGIGQHAGRHLHHGINIEIGRRQHAERSRRRIKGRGQVVGDAGRREALEEGQHVGQGDDAERQPATLHLFRGQVLHGFSVGLSLFCVVRARRAGF